MKYLLLIAALMLPSTASAACRRFTVPFEHWCTVEFKCKGCSDDEVVTKTYKTPFDSFLRCEPYAQTLVRLDYPWKVNIVAIAKKLPNDPSKVDVESKVKLWGREYVRTIYGNQRLRAKVSNGSHDTALEISVSCQVVTHTPPPSGEAQK